MQGEFRLRLHPDVVESKPEVDRKLRARMRETSYLNSFSTQDAEWIGPARSWLELGEQGWFLILIVFATAFVFASDRRLPSGIWIRDPI